MKGDGQSRRFGSLTVDLRSGEVQRNGRRVRLQDQPFQVLAALVERPGQLVSREELRQRVWPANTFVDFDNGLNIAIVKLRQALNDSAAHPKYIQTLPKRGYRFIAAADPVEEETAPVPAEEPVPAVEPFVAHIELPPRRSVLALAATAGIALAALGFGWGGALPHTTRPSAAVLGFRNLTADPQGAWLSTALAEMLSVDLSSGDQLRTVPGESIARARIELGLAEAGSYSAETLSRIRKDLRVDYVVAGSYFSAGGPALRLDVQLQDTRSGRTIAAHSLSGARDDLPGLVAQAGLALRQRLNLAAAGQADTRGVRAALPAAPDTARLYAEGLNLLRSFDAAGARALFEQVVKADPDYAMAHAALARAWAELGYGERAGQEAARAWAHSRDLPRADRLAIEAAYRQTTGEWDRAERIFQQIRDLFPDDVDYGVRLALADVKAGKGKEALALLDKLRHAPESREEPAIVFAQSLAAEQTGDLRQSQTAAAQAATVAESRGARMLVAQARAQECRVFRLLGNPDASRTACERAREIYAAAGDRGGAATVIGYLAAIRADEGDFAAAGELYGQAREIDREIGNEGGAIWELNGLADVLQSQGDLAGARQRFEEALEIARRTGSRPDQADALDNVATMAVLEGDLARGHKLFEEALAQYRSIPDRSGVGNALGNLGETMYLEGDLAGAARTMDEALAANRQAGSQAETADVLQWRGRVLLAQGRMDAARRQYEEALGIWTAMGSPGYQAMHGLRMAELSIASGHAADAQAPILRSLEIFEREKQRDAEIEARTLLARACLDQGRTADALREIERAEGFARGSRNRGVRLQFQTAAARTRKSEGALQAVIADAGQHGFVEYQLAARLALGDTELSSGRLDAGRRLLEAVEKDARGRGFELIARQAAALRERSGVQR